MHALPYVVQEDVLHVASLPQLVDLQLHFHGAFPLTVAGSAIPARHKPAAFTAPAVVYDLPLATPHTPSTSSHPPFCFATQSTAAVHSLHFHRQSQGPEKVVISGVPTSHKSATALLRSAAVANSLPFAIPQTGRFPHAAGAQSALNISSPHAVHCLLMITLP